MTFPNPKRIGVIPAIYKDPDTRCGRVRLSGQIAICPETRAFKSPGTDYLDPRDAFAINRPAAPLIPPNWWSTRGPAFSMVMNSVAAVLLRRGVTQIARPVDL